MALSQTNCNNNRGNSGQKPIEQPFTGPRSRFKPAVPRHLGAFSAVVLADNAVFRLRVFSANEKACGGDSGQPPKAKQQPYSRLQRQSGNCVGHE
jgi:hypothetical protein